MGKPQKKKTANFGIHPDELAFLFPPNRFLSTNPTLDEFLIAPNLAWLSLELGTYDKVIAVLSR